MENRTLKAVKRTKTGKNENNRLRAAGKVPANVIGNGETTPITLDEKDVIHLINSGVRQSSQINLDTEGEKHAVFIKELQRFPVSGAVRHIDLYKLTPGKKIITRIAIETTGTAKGSKLGGRFEHLLHEVVVKTTPEDMLEVISLDVTNLGIGDTIKISDLDKKPSWEVMINGDPIIASVIKTKAMIAAERAEAMEKSNEGKDKKKGK